MKLAVYFPGIGYHCDKPLLYYGRDVAYECGYDKYININYTCDIKNIRGNNDLMRKAFEQLYAQAEEQLEEIEFNENDDVIFISKSIGTVVAAAYAERKGLYMKNINLKNVFYTPLELTFDFEAKNGIAFMGTCDPWVEKEVVVEACRKADLKLYIIKNANHSLEVEDVMVNLENLKKIMEETMKYISLN